MRAETRWIGRARPWVFTGLVAGLIVYEWYALTTQEEGDTISERVWSAADKFPVVGFLAGILGGHWFWPRRLS